MKLNEIRGLSYAQFKKNLKAIEICLNYHFKNRTLSCDKLYRELNFIFYGLDICSYRCFELLQDQDKLIYSEFQTFYIDISRPYFVILIDGIEIDENISNIKIRLLT